MTIAIIVIVALVVLAAITIGATLRGRDADAATGRLARETLSRDRGTVTISETSVDVPTGKEVERSVALARREGAAVVKAESSEITEWIPPDAEQVGQSRRQFLNRSIIGSFALGLGPSAAGWRDLVDILLGEHRAGREDGHQQTKHQSLHDLLLQKNGRYQR